MMFVVAQGVILALGMAGGTVVHTVAAVLGLSAPLNAAPAALHLVRIGDALTAAELANPMVVLSCLAFVPQFSASGGWPAGSQIVVLGAMLIVIGLVMDGAAGILASTFSTFLLRRASTAILGGLAVRQFLSE